MFVGKVAVVILEIYFMGLFTFKTDIKKDIWDVKFPRIYQIKNKNIIFFSSSYYKFSVYQLCW